MEQATCRTKPASRQGRFSRSVAALILFAACCAGPASATEAKIYKNGGYEFAVGPTPAWVVPHEVPAQWDSNAPGASGARWRYWLVDSQIDRRHAARVRFFERVYEPLSSELVQDAGKIQIWFSPDHQRLTLHRVEVRRDGVWSDRLVPDAVTLARRENQFERDMANGLVSALVVLDDIRPGDVIRTSYTIDGDNPILAGLVDENFPFAGSEPLLARYARVLFDANAKIVEHRDAGAPATNRKRLPDGVEWSADRHAVASLIDEGNYPRWYDVAPTIDVGESHSWAEIASWAKQLYPPPHALPEDLEQRLSDWRKLAEPEARIAAALRAVQEEVRYFGTELGESTHRPSEPADTWTRRYGDCKDKARLLATLLNRLDVEAYPALVSIDRERGVADLPPAASLFDHVIVQARLHGQTLWLDATVTQQRGSPLSRAPGPFGVALPIAADTRDLVKVSAPSSAIDHLSITEHFRPDVAERSVSLEVDSVYEGAAADRMRQRLKSSENGKMERDYLEFYRRRYGDVSSALSWTLSDDEATNRLHIGERYVLKNPWVDASVGRRTIDLYADALGAVMAMPKTAERSAPMSIAYPNLVEETAVFDLPEGWQWASDPQQRKLEDAAGDFEFTARMSDRAVNVTHRFRARQDVVETSDFPKHFALLREANDLLGRRLVLTTAAKDKDGERNKRLENLMRNLLDDPHAQSKTGGG